jgi:hypothetical protein
MSARDPAPAMAARARTVREILISIFVMQQAPKLQVHSYFGVGNIKFYIL